MQWNRTSHCEFDGKSIETETTTSEFPIGRKAIVEQILVSEERNKSKRAGLWESQSGIRVGKLTIWVRSFEIEKDIFLGEIFETLYLSDNVEKSLVVRKSQRYLKTCRQNLQVYLSAYDIYCYHQRLNV